MFLNILVIAFVGAFIAIAAYGHVLLFTAIWPDAFGKRREPHHDTAVGAGQEIHQPN
jgi:hypothetical protein